VKIRKKKGGEKGKKGKGKKTEVSTAAHRTPPGALRRKQGGRKMGTKKKINHFQLI